MSNLKKLPPIRENVVSGASFVPPALLHNSTFSSSKQAELMEGERTKPRMLDLGIRSKQKKKSPSWIFVAKSKQAELIEGERTQPQMLDLGE